MPDVRVIIEGTPPDRCFFVLDGQELVTVAGRAEVELAFEVPHRLRYAFTGTPFSDFAVVVSAADGAVVVRRDASGEEVAVEPITGRIPEGKLFVGGNLRFKVKPAATP
ncbi:MAG: hypothetical protein SF066_12815 [Thermoanaerobaculia bacterium]|nr:hypothetical protein [Thermoanaerobaculia bacterium]